MNKFTAGSSWLVLTGAQPTFTTLKGDKAPSCQEESWVTGLEVAAVRFAFACSQLYFSAIICGAGKITQCTTKVSRFLLPVLCHLLFNATVSIFLRN